MCKRGGSWVGTFIYSKAAATVGACVMVFRVVFICHILGVLITEIRRHSVFCAPTGYKFRRLVTSFIRAFDFF